MATREDWARLRKDMPAIEKPPVTPKEVVPNIEDLRQQVDALRAVQRTLEESLISATGALDRARSAYTIHMMNPRRND
jgi:phage-related tail protein